MNRGVIAALVIALGAVGGSRDARAASAPGPDATRTQDDFAQVGNPTFKGWGKPVVLDHFMVNPSTPGLIIPCVKVLRGLWSASQSNPNILIRISVTYYSNGTERTEVFIAPLRDMGKTHHHQQPSKRFWIVDQEFQLAQSRDPGTSLTGSAELVPSGMAAAVPGS